MNVGVIYYLEMNPENVFLLFYKWHIKSKLTKNIVLQKFVLYDRYGLPL